MSHLTQFTSNNVLGEAKKSLLKKAVADLGEIFGYELELDENIKSIKNTWVCETVDAGIRKNGKKIAIGLELKKARKGYEVKVVGDFFGTGLDESIFVDRLAQQYKKHEVIKQCKEQGWNIDKKDISYDKKTEEYVITSYRYAV